MVGRGPGPPQQQQQQQQQQQHYLPHHNDYIGSNLQRLPYNHDSYVRGRGDAAGRLIPRTPTPVAHERRMPPLLDTAHTSITIKIPHTISSPNRTSSVHPSIHRTSSSPSSSHQPNPVSGVDVWWLHYPLITQPREHCALRTAQQRMRGRGGTRRSLPAAAAAAAADAAALLLLLLCACACLSPARGAGDDDGDDDVAAAVAENCTLVFTVRQTDNAELRDGVIYAAPGSQVDVGGVLSVGENASCSGPTAAAFAQDFTELVPVLQSCPPATCGENQRYNASACVCTCEDGWAGVNCSVCAANDVCSDARCDRAVPLTGNTDAKTYQCALDDDTLGKADAQIRMDLATGTGYAQIGIMRDTTEGANKLVAGGNDLWPVSCQLRKCSWKDELRVTCKSVSCTGTSTADLIDGDEISLACDKDGDCELETSISKLDMTCYTGDCTVDAGIFPEFASSSFVSYKASVAVVAGLAAAPLALVGLLVYGGIIVNNMECTLPPWLRKALRLPDPEVDHSHATEERDTDAEGGGGHGRTTDTGDKGGGRGESKHGRESPNSRMVARPPGTARLSVTGSRPSGYHGRRNSLLVIGMGGSRRRGLEAEKFTEENPELREQIESRVLSLMDESPHNPDADADSEQQAPQRGLDPRRSSRVPFSGMNSDRNQTRDGERGADGRGNAAALARCQSRRGNNDSITLGSTAIASNALMSPRPRIGSDEVSTQMELSTLRPSPTEGAAQTKSPAPAIPSRDGVSFKRISTDSASVVSPAVLLGRKGSASLDTPTSARPPAPAGRGAHTQRDPSGTSDRMRTMGASLPNDPYPVRTEETRRQEREAIKEEARRQTVEMREGRVGLNDSESDDDDDDDDDDGDNYTDAGGVEATLSSPTEPRHNDLMSPIADTGDGGGGATNRTLAPASASFARGSAGTPVRSTHGLLPGAQATGRIQSNPVIPGASRHAHTLSGMIRQSMFGLMKSVQQVERPRLRSTDVPDDLLEHHLVFEGLCAETETTQVGILRSVSGLAVSGKITAVMGPSGAGKSTLLNVLAGVPQVGIDVSGLIMVDNAPVGPWFKRIASFVQQDDVFMPTLTVRETILFSAYLRLSRDVSPSVTQDIAFDAMRELGLLHIADVLVGHPDGIKGISGGERRRLAIALEIVTQPKLLLLDEPTSGLDSFTAESLVQNLKRYARRNRIVMCSLHQPNDSLFTLVDRIIVLHAGQVMYEGSPSQLLSVMSLSGLNCPPGHGVADHLMHLMSEVTARNRLSAEFQSSGTAADERQSVVHRETTQFRSVWEVEASNRKEERKTLRWQYNVLLRRGLTHMIRDRRLLRAHLLVSIGMGCFAGAVFRSDDKKLGALQNRLGGVFFSLCFFCIAGLTALDTILTQRVITRRETRQAYYDPITGFIAAGTLDAIFLRIVPACFYACCMYPIMGLQENSNKFLMFVAALVLVNLVSGTLVSAAACVWPTHAESTLFITITFLLSALFSGFFINTDELSRGRFDVQYVSFIWYAYETMVANELTGLFFTLEVDGVGGATISGELLLDRLGLEGNTTMLNFCCLAAWLAGITGVVILFLRLQQRHHVAMREPTRLRRMPSDANVLTVPYSTDSLPRHQVSM